MFKYILRIKEATDEQLLLQISQKDKKKLLPNYQLNREYTHTTALFQWSVNETELFVRRKIIIPDLYLLGFKFNSIHFYSNISTTQSNGIKVNPSPSA